MCRAGSYRPMCLKLFAEACDPVEIVDTNGKCIGFLAKPFDQEDVQLAKESLVSDEPRYSTEQVLQHLRERQ